MASTNEKYYAHCVNCERVTYWIPTTGPAAGGYGYNCNGCGRLAKKGDPEYDELCKKAEEEAS